MTRLPQVGGDQGTWGQILNDYLSQAHNGDGTLKAQSDIDDAKAKADSAVQSVNGKSGATVTLAATDVSAEPTGLSNTTKSSLSSTYVPLPTTATSKNPLTGYWHVKGADATGATDSSAIIQAYINAAYSAGGGVVLLPAGTFQAELTMKHHVTLRGSGKRQTTIKAIAGSTNPGILQISAGYNQDTWVEDLYITGNGNVGQHGYYVNAQIAGADNNGGLWEGGMRRVKIGGLGQNGTCIYFTSTTGGNAPNQFLRFEHLILGAPVGGHAVYNDCQTGQITWDTCELDGPGLGTGTTANIELHGGYSWTFITPTSQSNQQAMIIDGVQGVALINPYFENIGQCITVTQGGNSTPAFVTIDNPHFANAGYISSTDSTGYLISNTSSIVFVRGGSITGNFSHGMQGSGTTFWEDVWHSSGTTISSSASTTQISVESSGRISPTNGHSTYIVNTSTTPITYINASLDRLAGTEINLLAFNGPLTFSSSYSDSTVKIYTGGQPSTFTVPQDSIVTLIRLDLGRGWVVKSVSSSAMSIGTGTVTLTAGTVAVANTKVTANTIVRVDRQAAGGTLGELSIALTAGTGFTINSSSNTETSSVYYEIVSY